jgi:hypothetical protein
VDLQWLRVLFFFVGTIVLVMLFFEMGYRLGMRAHRLSSEEKETTISGVAGAVLGLNAFLLAFTFSAVADRFQDRKVLVRDDANAIRVAYARADFLPPGDREESKRLLRHYLDTRMAFADSGDIATGFSAVFAESDATQRRLWKIAVGNAERDMNSDVAALYIESLNDLASVNTNRVAKGVRARVPTVIWVALCSLTILGMVSMGYHTGIAGSRRSKAIWIVAFSFAMVIALVAALDRPGLVKVSQQPMLDLKAYIASDTKE